MRKISTAVFKVFYGNYYEIYQTKDSVEKNGINDKLINVLLTKLSHLLDQHFLRFTQSNALFS